MIFRRELARKILEGNKTATRRVMSPNPRSPWAERDCAYIEGQRFKIQPGRGQPHVAVAEVMAVFSQRLGEMHEWQAVQEGFANLREFQSTWHKLHGAWHPDEEVWVVEFVPLLTYSEDCPEGCFQGRVTLRQDVNPSPCPHCRWWKHER